MEMEGRELMHIDVSNAKSFNEKVANELHVAKQQGNKEEVDDDKELGHLRIFMIEKLHQESRSKLKKMKKAQWKKGLQEIQMK